MTLLVTYSSKPEKAVHSSLSPLIACWDDGRVEKSVYQPLGGYFEGPERAEFHLPLFEKHQCQRSHTKPFDQVSDHDSSNH